MRVTIVTVGSRGDVEPYIALGVGLKRAGHEVTLATHATFESVIREREIGFSCLEGNPQELLETNQGQAWLKSGSNPFAFLSKLSAIMLPMMERMLKDAMAACQDADVVVPSILGALATYHVIEKLNSRAVPAFLQPASPTRAFPSPSFPPHAWGGLYNRFTYTMSEQVLWNLMKGPINQARQEVLGLPPLSKAWFSSSESRQVPILYGYSPQIVPKPSDWPEWLHVTGYWFLEPPTGWQPPEGLVDFIASGPPPVCIGFSSMKDREQEEITEIVLKALAMARRRGVLVTGWGGLTGADLPDDVFKIREAPFGWLFPQMAAVVHHGGAGTTAAGLRAGVPAVAVPFFADQSFWADRVFRLGAGPKPIPRKRLSAERLADAIRTAVTDDAMRKRAASLGDKLSREDGVARAVEVFGQLLADDRRITSYRELAR